MIEGKTKSKSKKKVNITIQNPLLYLKKMPV